MERYHFAGLGDTSTRDSIVIDGKLPTVKKIDNYTVEFTTPKPFAPFIRMLSTSIAPKHVFMPAIKKDLRILIHFYQQIQNHQIL